MRRSQTSKRLNQGWDRGFSPASEIVLRALTGGYRGLLTTREWLYARGLLSSRPLACPVVSVGNLTVGGTGKTPAVELAVQTLTRMGHRPAVVSRGYQRRSRGIQVVADSASIRLDAEDAGDEPFLLARRLPGVPVVVGSNRHETARLAIERFGVTAVVLDDGFQHRTLRKDLEIVMVHARNPWGNGRLLPGGPLREPLSALSRADLVVAADASGLEDFSAVEASVAQHAPWIPVLGARYVPVACWEAERMRAHSLADLAGTKLVAFAGIASPAGFERTLHGLGIGIAEMARFPDHHWYVPDELAALDGRVGALGAQGLVTTEKDWVRLRRLPLPRRPLYVIAIRLELVKGAEIWRRALERACPKP